MGPHAMQRFNSRISIALACALGLGVPLGAGAQQPPEGTRVIVVPSCDAIPAGAVLSPTTGPTTLPTAGPTTGPTAGPASTQPARLPKFLSLRFPRTAASVLQAR